MSVDEGLIYQPINWCQSLWQAWKLNLLLESNRLYFQIFLLHVYEDGDKSRTCSSARNLFVRAVRKVESCCRSVCVVKKVPNFRASFDSPIGPTCGLHWRLWDSLNLARISYARDSTIITKTLQYPPNALRPCVCCCWDSRKRVQIVTPVFRKADLDLL